MYGNVVATFSGHAHFNGYAFDEKTKVGKHAAGAVAVLQMYALQNLQFLNNNNLNNKYIAEIRLAKYHQP